MHSRRYGQMACGFHSRMCCSCYSCCSCSDFDDPQAMDFGGFDDPDGGLADLPPEEPARSRSPRWPARRREERHLAPACDCPLRIPPVLLPGDCDVRSPSLCVNFKPLTSASLRVSTVENRTQTSPEPPQTTPDYPFFAYLPALCFKSEVFDWKVCISY